MDPNYPSVDPTIGCVSGAEIGFAGTPWEKYRHIIDGNADNTVSKIAVQSIQKNQAIQFQVRLFLNNPDNVLQAAQFVPAKNVLDIDPVSGNPKEYPDVFTWPNVLGNRQGLTLADVPEIKAYFNSGKEPWPIIEHGTGNVAGGGAASA